MKFQALRGVHEFLKAWDQENNVAFVNLAHISWSKAPRRVAPTYPEVPKLLASRVLAPQVTENLPKSREDFAEAESNLSTYSCTHC